MSAEPRAGAAATGGCASAPRRARARARLQVALLAAAGAAVLAGALLIAAELAAARVPEQRAALEELIRRETGLEVSFRALSVRWGWYGPEAVFHGVMLGEPAGGGVLLRAPRLSVALDAWRMVRSGHLEAARITLERPDIDLGAAAAARAGAPATATATALMRPDPFVTGARVLARWRGGRIAIEGGTVRGLLAPGAPAVELAVRHAELRRQGDEWRAEAIAFLPESLGSSARLRLAMHGDPAHPERTRGTLDIDGQRLEFAGWRALAARSELARYLPGTGSGNLALAVAFSGSQLLEAHGSIYAGSIGWAGASGSAPLALPRLRGAFALERRGGEWRLTADALDTGGGARGAVKLELAAAADGRYAHGVIRNLAVPLLAALGRACAPQLPLAQFAFGGRARQLTFDWDAARPAGARLITAVDLEDLTLASAEYGVRLAGLTAHVSGADTGFIADVGSVSATLSLARAQPLELDALTIAARLALDASGAGWRLESEDLEVRRGAQSLAASGMIAAAAAGTAPRVRARLAVKDVDLALARTVLGPGTVAALGSAAAHLSSGRIATADLAWRGVLDGGDRARPPGGDFTGALVLREASL
ncbi:MAG: hypothetical protein JO173_02400, partial [Gammaproteobacteria bacterium]|nr:hypothetical protein [Gammaproteobacteria bacterium]